MPIFEKLWRELGWTVAYGSNLSAEGMKMESQAPFLRGYKFRKGPGTSLLVPVGKILRDLKPDAIIAEGALRMSSSWELLVRRKLLGGPKVFFWSIGHNPAKAKKPGERGSGQWKYPALYRFADGCLTYGNDGRAFLQPRIGGKPVFVAYNSVDMQKIFLARDNIAALPRRGFPELVSVSRLTPGKEYVKLVQAFHIILQSYPTAQLTIIGDGPDLEAIKQAAGAELGKRIHLLGACYDENEVAPHMNRADAFVMTGRVGLAINHALGYNLPVICFQRTDDGPYHGSEITHLREGITGYEVKGYDSRLFADQVVSLFRRMPDFKVRHRDGIEQYVAENMSIDLMASGFRAIDSHLRELEEGLSAQAAE